MSFKIIESIGMKDVHKQKELGRQAVMEELKQPNANAKEVVIRNLCVDPKELGKPSLRIIS